MEKSSNFALLDALTHFDENDFEEILRLAKQWCLLNGLICFDQNSIKNIRSTPFTLIPWPVSAKEYFNAIRLEPMFSHLMFKISNDPQFLYESLKE
jgi:hypothetical protein